MMTSSVVSSFHQDSTNSPRFRPYASAQHHVTKGRYITSNDPRGYIPVYEYPLNGQWIMMDIDDGYILWTGIWKALGNSKADIVKMIDSQPELAPLIRRVRGGYLKIQGTWMPYEVALRLSRRVAWPIREDLVPLFGPTFPSTCLSPDQPGYGQVVTTGPGRRRTRRHTHSIICPPPKRFSPYALPTPPSSAPYSFTTFPAYSSRPRPSSWSAPSPKLTLPPLPSTPMLLPLHHHPHTTNLPHPLRLPLNKPNRYALPPISAMEDLRGLDERDSAAVLRRLTRPDSPPLSPRPLSLSLPSSNSDDTSPLSPATPRSFSSGSPSLRTTRKPFSFVHRSGPHRPW